MEPSWLDQVPALANDVLTWIGFGTVVGLLARLLMPGRDYAGAIANLVMGIAGTVLGCGTLALILEERVSPLSPTGLLVAIAGAFSILLIHRLISGRNLPIDAPERRRYYRRTRRTYVID